MKKILYAVIGILISSLIYVISLQNMPEPIVARSKDSIGIASNDKTDKENEKKFIKNILKGYIILFEDLDSFISAKIIKFGRNNPMAFVETKKIISENKENGENETITATVSNNGFYEYNLQFSNVINDYVNGINIITDTIESINIENIIQTFGGLFVLPVDKMYYSISSGFGKRIDPIDGKERLHKGIDISFKDIQEANAYSILPGQIKKIEYDNLIYGNYVTVNHGNLNILYSHLDIIREGLREKDLIGAGQIIGQIGSTGKSTGPHLHVEFNIGNIAVNPKIFLDLIN